MFVVAEPVEDADDRLGDVQHFTHGQEVEEHVPRAHHRRRAAGDSDREPALGAAVFLLDSREKADVVDRAADVIVRAALEGNLELARQRRAERMAEQIARQGFGVRRDVERLVGGDAGVRAGGDVPHRVAARFSGRQACVCQVAHRRLDVVQLEEVQLDVLPRGDVPEAAGVPLGDVRQRVQLRLAEDALRNLHAQHLGVAGLPLTVRAPQQPERPPLVRSDLAALETREHRDELVDVAFVGKRQPGAAQCVPFFSRSH